MKVITVQNAYTRTQYDLCQRHYDALCAGEGAKYEEARGIVGSSAQVHYGLHSGVSCAVCNPGYDDYYGEDHPADAAREVRS